MGVLLVINGRIRSEFDTLQLYKDGKPTVRVPREYGDREGAELEPITKAYPEFGKGDRAQLHADKQIIKYEKSEVLQEE